MSQIQTNRFYSKQLRKVISFFKYSSTKYLNILYIIVFCAPIFLMTFQNCKITDNPIPEERLTSPGNPENKSAANPEEIGSIVQIDPENGDVIEDQLLPIDSDIIFKFLNAGTTSDNYKWTIKRGFESTVTDASTQTDTYSTKFSELGAYDVFAISYKATEPKARASKRFVVGESCSLNDILEIELLSETSASLKVGGSEHSTFGLRDSSNFSSIKWKTTLPSGQVIENEGEDTLEVDLSSESRGLLVIEVSAMSSIVSRDGCLVHGRKELIVTSNVRPYFNPISFADGIDGIPVMLENEIYKYEKPNMLFVQIQVLNADSCQYQTNGESKVDFKCDSELIEVLSNLDADCIKGIVTLFASENQGEIHSQSYYHYCPSEGDYCYFGPVSERPSHHVCSVEVANPVSGSCGSAEGICQSGQPRDTQDTETHYQWQCVGSEGGSTEDCQEAKTINTTSTTIQGCPSGEYRSRTVCENVKPSNSTCSLQSNECYKWSCDNGYTQSGNSCVQACPSGQYDSKAACSTASPDNSTCSSQDNRCYSWSCDSGYTQSGNSCTRDRVPITITHLRTPDLVGRVVEGCQNNSGYNACVFGIGNTKNYGVNILDTINNFLENSSYKVVINGLQRATLASGKWTRAYNSDPNFNNSQANLYHWLMYQKEWMELNAGSWYASDKDITAEIRDINSDRGGGGFWSWGRNLMSFPRSNNLFWLIFHEAGHANLYYSRGKYVRRENQTKCLSSSRGSSNLCCSTYKGCFSAINEGQAEFHEYLINNLAVLSSISTSVSSRRKRRCKSNITLESTAKAIFDDCDTIFPEGQVHTTGFLVYTTLWYQIYNHPNVNKKYITVLFSEHLPLLEGDDTFVTAGVKIVSLAKQLFDESTGASYAEIIKTIFKNRGLPLD